MNDIYNTAVLYNGKNEQMMDRVIKEIYQIEELLEMLKNKQELGIVFRRNISDKMGSQGELDEYAGSHFKKIYGQNNRIKVLKKQVLMER